MPKLILLQDIEDLGNAGEIVNVSEGYARNYLLPKGLAIKESKSALRQLEARREKIEEQRKAEIAKAATLAEKIQSIELTISAQASDDKQLYGSISAVNIASELAKLGVDIEHRRIMLEHPIKEIGEYKIKIKLHKDFIPELKVKVQKT
ncbi:MAG TPA: 50S ribosomal protein L9 [Victivallales bacterium]|nr:50S ribosomal protein L9 [Victivallales bacterium]HPO90362.1 50S ribosomal protein L9 [Victivallales bacterium]HRR28742.1 50S ribosomal protein L9 [Victivallales bacterium]HRU00437.1 50S ribosomal protein L9 [Victivallales bacterium]